MDRVHQASVESIVAQVEAAGADGALQLWVPDRLTHGGKTVSSDVGRAIVFEAAMAKGFKPDRTLHENGGKLCCFFR